MAARMIGPGGTRLEELEKATGKHFSIVATDGVPRERCSFLKEGTVSEVLEDAIPVEAGQELEVSLSEPHMYQAADAVAVLEGGYRVVVAGAGPYLGEKQRIKIERIGRLEAHAVLLDAKPITEEEMIKMVDPRSDVHEPPRLVGERIDLEGKKRKGKRSRTPSATIDTPTGDMTASVGEETEPLDLPEEPEVVVVEGEESEATPKQRRSQSVAASDLLVDGDDEHDEDDEDDEDEDGEEATAEGGAPKKRRRRGRRGGRGRSTGGSGAANAPGDAPATEGEEPAPRAAQPAREGATEGADGDGPVRPKRRRSRGGRGRSRSGSGTGAAGGNGEGGGQESRGQNSRPKSTEPAPTAKTEAPAAGKPAAATKPKRSLLGRILGKD